jgi:hypothetical protein
MNSLYQKIINVIEQSVQEYIQKISNKYDLNEKELVEMWNAIDSEKDSKKDSKKDNEKDNEKNSKKDNEKDNEKTSKVLNNIEDDNVCPYVFTKGYSAGEKCGCKPKNDSLYCSKHKKYEGDENKEKIIKKVLPIPKKSIIPISPPKKSITQLKPNSVSIILRMNKNINKLWHSETGMVFKSKDERIVIGKNVNDKIQELSEDDLEICKSMNFRYEIKEKIPENIKNVSHKITSIEKESTIMKKSIHKAINDTNSKAEDIEEILNKLQKGPDYSSDIDSEEEELEEEELEEEY